VNAWATEKRRLDSLRWIGTRFDGSVASEHAGGVRTEKGRSFRSGPLL